MTLSKSPTHTGLPLRREVSQPWQGASDHFISKNSGARSRTCTVSWWPCHRAQHSPDFQQEADFQELSFPVNICSALPAASSTPKGLLECPGQQIPVTDPPSPQRVSASSLIHCSFLAPTGQTGSLIPEATVLGGTRGRKGLKHAWDPRRPASSP